MYPGRFASFAIIKVFVSVTPEGVLAELALDALGQAKLDPVFIAHQHDA